MSEKFIPLFGYEIFTTDHDGSESVCPIQGIYVTTCRGMGTITGYLTTPYGVIAEPSRELSNNVHSLRRTPINTE